ncbi:MAG: helix-turn-helix transcriptional regulator [Bacillota bacterium]
MKNFKDNKNNKNYLKENFHISHRKSPQALRGHRHYHNAYEFLLCNKGSGDFFIKNTNHPIKDKTLFILDKRDIHLPRLKKDSKIFDRFVIQFESDFLTDFYNFDNVDFDFNCLFTEKLNSINLKEDDHLHLKKLSEKILYESTKKKEGYDSLIYAYLLELLISVCRLSKNNKLIDLDDKNKNRLNKIIDFINENLTDKITLDKIADEFYISKYYLCRYFKNKTGFTVVEFINHRRIIEAQGLLIKTDKNITDISMDVGFNSLNHFERVFKENNGITPSQYRNLYT